MHDSMDQFKLTVDHLTAIAHLRKERDQPELPIDIANIIRNALLDLPPHWPKQTVVSTWACGPAPNWYFLKNLHSVVYNLLSSALKYRHPDRKPLVRVHSYFEGEHVVLKVRNNGLEMNISTERPLFSLFQRYHTHIKGSGVELYMVEKMMENTGGHIAMQSQVGTGSTFSVYFKH